MSLAGVPPPATAEAASIAVAPSAPPAAGVDGVDVQMTSTEDDAAAEQAKSDAELIRRTEEEKIAKEEKEKAEWTETLYIQNLNEDVKLDVMKTTLRSLFKIYGEVLDVVAHQNYRMRGQAFVSFADKEKAAKALKEVKGFPLYGKPMQISWAKTRSDAVVSKLEPANLPAHKDARLIHKAKARRSNPHRQKAQALLKAAEADPSGSGGAGGGAAVGAPAPKRQQVLMPDEYLPPNPTLFVQNLPEGTTKEDLIELFSKHPNLVLVRMVAAKKDIAFVDFADEASSTLAKDGLNGHKFTPGGEPMKVTFARM